MVEFAILGLLHEAPMHGYELRKRLADLCGTFRAFSYGSLYPALKRLQRSGLIAQEAGPAEPASPAASERQHGGAEPDEKARSWGRRAKKTYRLTAEGKQQFTVMLADGGPQAWDDDGFGLHMAFFSRTSAEVRMRILEGRRRRVEERREGLRSALARAGEQIDRYTRELHRMGLESSEREVRWLNELIEHERTEQLGHEQ